MRNFWMQPIVLIVGLAMLIAAPVFAGEQADPTISVTGDAEIKVKPDQALFSFSIQGREKTLDEAVATNDKAIAKVVQFLRTAGVEDKDVRTEVVRIQPIYRPLQRGKIPIQIRPQGNLNFNPAPNAAPVAPVKDEDPLKPIGYEARRGISVTVTNLANLEKIYTGLLKNGVNEVGGISFETTELRKYRDEARLKAVRAAREKATALAGELGVKLAGVQQISESNWRSPSPFQNSVSLAPTVMMGGSNGNSFSQGVIDITASVSVVFLLADHKFDVDSD
ncbi:SIMPL domain-containing protein [Mariniblastus sp.]|nr:SIMPL domain-containing protein [Mariniblastus sp.]